jgi:hypothetical protein
VQFDSKSTPDKSQGESLMGNLFQERLVADEKDLFPDDTAAAYTPTFPNAK